MDKPPPEESGRTSDGRLDSWKKIAVYLKRDITTVQRWEKREGMPVHRHLHDKTGSVYAFRSELDAWTQSRSAQPAVEGAETEPLTGASSPVPARIPTSARRRNYLTAGAAVLSLLALIIGWSAGRDQFWGNC